MDVPSEYRQPGQKRRGKGNRGGGGTSRPQLFEDTSNNHPAPPPQPQGYPMNYGQQPQYGYEFDQPGMYAPPPGGQFPGQQFLQDPMASMAMQYGTTLADQGKEYVHKNLEKYVAPSKLKFYFAVDTTYVGKKLGLILFPYAHSDWTVQYSEEDPVAPRYNVNAPDLYIPVMAFVTYILVAGVMLGIQERFTPEQIGIQASTALVWIIIELVASVLGLYIMNLTANLKYTDCLAYSGYKFVGMIFSLLGGMAFQGTGYYITLLWFSVALTFFLVCSLKEKVTHSSAGEEYRRGGTKRSLYFTVAVALAQPLLMWWLTSHIMFGRKA
ncbi:protein YIF1B-A-like [Babylonia areolata]|uniref:protein YIF1B-A-like n=1 Tax=Babylonia areolata TaxID=304850 RepID=UPI003FD1E7BC